MFRLPYSFNDIKIKSNDLVTANNFLNATAKLYSNLVFIIEQTNINGLSILYNTNLIPLSSLIIKEEEFASNYSINKTLSKILFNVLSIRENFYARFIVETGQTEIENIEHIYGISFDTFYTIPNLNYFVGINELVSTAVINRCLQNIYNIEENLFDFCEVTTSDFIPVTTTITLTAENIITPNTITISTSSVDTDTISLPYSVMKTGINNDNLHEFTLYSFTNKGTGNIDIWYSTNIYIYGAFSSATLNVYEDGVLTKSSSVFSVSEHGRFSANITNNNAQIEIRLVTLGDNSTWGQMIDWAISTPNTQLNPAIYY